jgi:outer membrane protein
MISTVIMALSAYIYRLISLMRAPTTGPTIRPLLSSLLSLSICLSVGILSAEPLSPESPAKTAQASLNPKAVTLNALISCARDRNPMWEIAHAQLKDAIAQLAYAERSRFPSLSMSGILAPLPVRRLMKYCVSSETFDGRDLVIPCPNQNIQDDQRIDDVDGMGVFVRATATLTQPLYTFGKIDHGIRAATHQVKAYRENQITAERTYDSLALETYYGLLLGQRAMKVFKKGRKKLNALKRKIIKDLANEGGQYTSNDKRRLFIQEAELTARELEVVALRERGLTGIRVSCQLEPEQEITLDTKRLKPIDVPIKTEAEYWSDARQLRPELRAADAALNAREAMIDQAWAQFMPSLALIGTFGYSLGTSAEDNPDPFANDPFNALGYGAYLGVDWRLNFAQLTSAYSRAQAAKTRASAERRGLERQLRLEVSERYQQLKRFQGALSVRKKAMKMGKQWMTSNFLNLELGLIDSDQLLDSLKAYFSASLAYDQTVYEYNAALGRLWTSSGLDLLQLSSTSPSPSSTPQ